MSWKLLLMLSGFAAAMSLATVFVLPSKIEPLFWLAIFVACAWIIAQKAPGRYFLHGFALGLINCVWVTGGHILFAATYLARHPDEAAMAQKTPFPDSPRLMMALTGPVIGVISGVVLGLFAWVASKLAPKG
jgi:hypothetical protein